MTCGAQRTRHLVVAVVIAVVAATVGAVTVTVAGPEPAAAQSGGCSFQSGHRVGDGGAQLSGRRKCDGGGKGGRGGGGGDGGSGGSGGAGGEGSGPPPCPRWQLIGSSSGDDLDNDGLPDFPVPSHIRPSSWDAAPPGSSFYYDACTSPNGFGPGSTTMWLPPGAAAAPAPPSPEEVAEDVWVEIRETLERPALEVSPALGEPALIYVPTFVRVTNWQGEISRSRCELGVCIALTATPSLHFDPGEPGAGTITCDPPGTRFDPSPSAPPPREQAAVEGACAHGYDHHTESDDRPEAWPGEVRVVWDVQWTDGGAVADEFEFTLSTDLPRAVREGPTVVERVD